MTSGSLRSCVSKALLIGALVRLNSPSWAASPPKGRLYYTTPQGASEMLELPGGKRRTIPCLGWISPDGRRFACIHERDTVTVLAADGTQLHSFTVPPYAASPGQAPHIIELRGIHWSPDGKKLLLESSYHDLHRIYTVYDLAAMKVIYQRHGNNLLSWLPDSVSYMTHDSYEGFSGSFAMKDGRNEQHITLFRNTLDGKERKVWGRVSWEAEPPAPGNPPSMAAVESVQALSRGTVIQARVLGRGGMFTGEAPSRGRNPLKSGPGAEKPEFVVTESAAGAHGRIVFADKTVPFVGRLRVEYP